MSADASPAHKKRASVRAPTVPTNRFISTLPDAIFTQTSWPCTQERSTHAPRNVMREPQMLIESLKSNDKARGASTLRLPPDFLPLSSSQTKRMREKCARYRLAILHA